MITTYKGKEISNAKFSIIIPTWNNLDYIKLCIESIRKNSHFDHQIIVHVNDGSDGTLDWVRKENLFYSHSKDNVGVCWAVNIARSLVQTDYIFYLNDDMYVCPGWDIELWKEIESLDTNYFFISSTMLEPYPTVSTPVIAPCNYGTTTQEFDEKKLLDEYMKYEKADWYGATRPPNIVHKELWDLIGGYSTEFSPGLYSDPDFSMKLWQAGVREFKGISKSRVYHFVSKSLNRIKKNNGRKQFLNKWGITSSTFSKFYLKLGDPYKGDYEINYKNKKFKKALLKSKVKRFLHMS